MADFQHDIFMLFWDCFFNKYCSSASLSILFSITAAFASQKMIFSKFETYCELRMQAASIAL
ncbi:hypothetical protein C9419_04195 [Paraburkholderia fungorum]|nr:hypothetical protein C9419_04195 [Paraburkholderia fungorum]